MWYLLFLAFTLFISFIDIILTLSYLIFIYIYLLSPLYYLIIYLLGYIKLLLPLLFIYYLLCYYTIQHKGYTIFYFFGYSLIPLKYKLLYLKYNHIYNIYYYYFINFIIVMFISICWLKSFNWLVFLLLCNLYIIYFYLLFKIINKNTYINLFLVYITYIYLYSFSLFDNMLNKDYEAGFTIFELFNFRLHIRDIYIDEIYNYDLELYIDDINMFKWFMQYQLEDNIRFNNIKNIDDLDYYNERLIEMDFEREIKDLLFYYKLSDVSKFTENNYLLQRKLIYEEFDTYRYYMPLGQIKKDFNWLLDKWKINLKPLYDIRLSSNNNIIDISNIVLYKLQKFYNHLNYKEYVYMLFNLNDKNINNNELCENLIIKDYNNLYYNNDLQSNLDNFLLNYCNKKLLYYKLDNLTYNEYFLLKNSCEESLFFKSYMYNNWDLKTIKFWENFNLDRWYKAVNEVNYTKSEEWLGKTFEYIEDSERYDDDIELMERIQIKHEGYIKSKHDIQELYLRYYYANEDDESKLLMKYLRYRIKNIYPIYENKKVKKK